MRIMGWLGGAAVFGAGLMALVGASAPAMAAEWIGGHYDRGGHWVPGHWIGGPGVGPPPEVLEEPPGFRPGRVWIVGHYDRRHEWIPGHWR
jgi:hypothetical protein